MNAANPCPDCGNMMCTCGFSRMAEEQKQMREHSGPLYELAVQRGRTSYDAWQKAGRPPRLTLVSVPVRDADGNIVHDADGEPRYEGRWCLSAALKRGELVEATPEQLAARAAYGRATQAG